MDTGRRALPQDDWHAAELGFTILHGCSPAQASTSKQHECAQSRAGPAREAMGVTGHGGDANRHTRAGWASSQASDHKRPNPTLWDGRHPLGEATTPTAPVETRASERCGPFLRSSQRSPKSYLRGGARKEAVHVRILNDRTRPHMVGRFRTALLALGRASDRPPRRSITNSFIIPRRRTKYRIKLQLLPGRLSDGDTPPSCARALRSTDAPAHRDAAPRSGWHGGTCRAFWSTDDRARLTRAAVSNRYATNGPHR